MEKWRKPGGKLKICYGVKLLGVSARECFITISRNFLKMLHNLPDCPVWEAGIMWIEAKKILHDLAEFILQEKNVL